MFWLNLVACFCSLGLALAFLLAGARGRLAPRVSLMAVSMFAWNFSSIANGISQTEAWAVLDLAASPLSVALGLDIALTFTGRAREHRTTLWISYVWFGAISLWTVLSYYVPQLSWWSNSPAIHVMDLVGLVAAFGLAVALLLAHARRHAAQERRQALVLAAGFVLGGLCGSSALLSDAGIDFPTSAAPGAIVGTGALAWSLAHENLVGVRIGRGVWAVAAGLSVVACGGLLLVFALTDPNSSAQLFGAVTVILVVGVVAREVAARRWRQRKQETEAIVRGRLSDQLVHDLRNPLAALQGAAQYLEAERETLAPEQASMVDMVLSEAVRIERLLAEHHRMARAEPHRAPANLRDLLERLGSRSNTASSRHPVEVEVAPGAERAVVDADLVALSIENLVRNAREALPEGGRIRIVARDEDHHVAISVHDSGQGLDARARERAFDELFTTKKEGKGLGLAFVRRVARAHGGDATISSGPEIGTTVTMFLRSR
jgi:two-component system sensor histidine kinase HydH